MKFKKQQFQPHILCRVFLYVVVPFLSGILVIPGATWGTQNTDTLKAGEPESKTPLSSNQIKEAFRGFQSSLKTNESDTFAGLYVRHSPSYRFIVLFTRDGEETVKPYIPKGMESYVEVQTVTYSLDDLHSARELITSFLDGLGIKSDSGTSYMQNHVEFTVLDSDWTVIEMAIENGQFIIPDCVSIDLVEELSKPSTVYE